MSLTTTTSTEDRVLRLLGQGIGPEIVAATVGISVSRVSQLISDPIFAEQVATLRFAALSKHNDRDERYDNLEDVFLDRMEALAPMMYKPGEVLNALTKVNLAKRRGVASSENLHGTREVVSLTLPTVLLQQFNTTFQTNIHNQVVKAGNQDLVTVQSGRMNDMLKTIRALPASAGETNVEPPHESRTERVEGS